MPSLVAPRRAQMETAGLSRKLRESGSSARDADMDTHAKRASPYFLTTRHPGHSFHSRHRGQHRRRFVGLAETTSSLALRGIVAGRYKNMPTLARSFDPDGSVLPAMQRLRREDKLRWIVLKFSSPMGRATDVLDFRDALRTRSACWTCESLGPKEGDGIADWSRLLKSLPDNECRIAVFRHDFRARRTFVMVHWSPPSHAHVEMEETKVWDIRDLALKQGVDPARVEAAEMGDAARESLVELCIELTGPEKLRRVYAKGLETLSKFVKVDEVLKVQQRDELAHCVEGTKELLREEAEAAAREVQRAADARAERQRRQLAEAYGTAFHYRRTKYEREQAAEAAAKTEEERLLNLEAEKDAARRRREEEARKRAEYGADAERDPVWRARLAAAREGQETDLTRWYHEHGLVAPADPQILHKGVRKVRVSEASALVRGQVSMDMLEQSMVKSQRLLAEAKLATSLVREGPVKAIDWEAEREVMFGEETLAPGSIGMRVVEDQYGQVTVGALLSKERYDATTDSVSYTDGRAKACGEIRVGDRIVRVAVGEPGVTPPSQLMEFAGPKLKITAILGVLARQMRPIKITFAPPKFGGHPPEPEQPVVAVEWGEPADKSGPLGPAVSRELSAIEPESFVDGADDCSSEYSSAASRRKAKEKEPDMIGVGPSARPAIGIRLPMRRIN